VLFQSSILVQGADNVICDPLSFPANGIRRIGTNPPSVPNKEIFNLTVR
jgi:hypothetical protein